LFIQDLGFSKFDAKPGSVVKNVSIERLDGSPTTIEDVMDGRPMLIVFGSVSCPMTFGSVDVLHRLHAEFGRKIKFAMLNVREAHPGENFEQPQSQQKKREHARLLASETNGHWETLVDTIDGELHCHLAEKPNAAFLLGPDRKILFRSLWGSDEKALRQALSAVSSGLPLPKQQSSAAIGPLGIGLGFFAPILARSGKKAKLDLLLAAPPVAAIAALASVFGSLPMHRRGQAAMGLGLIVGLFALVALAWMLRPLLIA
jgi:hypothetical protein